jgi:hypothetical protein
MNRRALSIGWLFLALFMLAVVLVILISVPEEHLPKQAQAIIDKTGLKGLITTRDSTSKPCPALSAKDCLDNMQRGCLPKYSMETGNFLECGSCPSQPICTFFGQERACKDNPCGLLCRWVVGEYEGGFTLRGRCVDNTELSQMRREISQHGFDAGGFGSGEEIKRAENGSCVTFTAGAERIVLDTNLSVIHIYMEGNEQAYDRLGSPVEGSCGG